MDRRSFLKSSLLLSASALLPNPANAANVALGGFASSRSNPFDPNRNHISSQLTPFQNFDNLLPGNPKREIWLKRPESKEEIKITYCQNGQYLKDPYIDLCSFFRDIHAPKNEQTVQIDIKLFDLLFACQEWLRYYKKDFPIILLSGYRTKFNNSRIERAAKDSMHTHGKAGDIRIPGLPNSYIAQLVSWFNAGGVGVYANDNFIHVDTGPLRSWRG